MNRPIETPRMNEYPQIAVIVRRSLSGNQFADTLAQAFIIKGWPIATMVCPTITKVKLSLMRNLSHRPTVVMPIPIDKPNLRPMRSMAQTAGWFIIG